MQSMTGCGKYQLLRDGFEITAEIKTVNHRFLDISCRLPRALSFLENTVRSVVSKGIRRGHADVFLSIRNVNGGDRVISIDADLARSYAEAAETIASATGTPSQVGVREIMQMEGVLTVSETAMDEELVTSLTAEALGEAVQQLISMRAKEGVALYSDLEYHLDQAAQLREKILERAPGVVADYAVRLKNRLDQMLTEGVDPVRLAQEVALLADRCAIDEELSRLDSHFHQMRQYLKTNGEIGKKMDFLIQEMNREANTIGSKANDAVIAQFVVDLKSEIEKLREQVQNVE